ncbi:MAG: MBL fold metallo-hydrolase [Clostridium sp.]|uniref:MBL fold metallo-hydrolase n=1 Tax=Clostridium sp. TaxID=1506 RepID=UPI00290A2E04|nr:MBL fold metallo-hydrolase [Clostridium sp.]MDU7337230.1 MBL fold metallo-hydrolase [Clostridium sp.]
MARFCPLFSGSSGNSFYVGSRDAGVLIDIGRSARQITKMLESCEIPTSAIKGIFVTHEHTDHVKGLRVFTEKNQIPVYASAGTLQALEDSGEITAKMSCCVVEEKGIECAEMLIRPFPISHDCAEGTGYRVQTADDRMFTLATDLGYISDEVCRELETSNLVVLESNHDVGMLQNGPYPYYLKRRILSDVGHLSNEVCSQILPHLAGMGTTRFVLAHLSAENNTPDIAYQSALCALKMAGLEEQVDFELMVASRENHTGKVILF